nr:GNAT family N-acetyltransferase [Ruegeria sp. HKCCE3926]
MLAAIRNGVAPGLALTDTPAGTHTVFELPDTFEGYLANLSKKRRSQYRRDLKHLQNDHGLTTRMVHPDAHQFRDFVSFHNRQWQEVGKGGHFADWPGSAAFYCDLADATQQGQETWFVEQHGRNGPLATQFCLVAGQTCHWRLPARSTDPELERLSLGKIGLVQMIEQLIAAGVTRIEAGIGAYGYKLVYGGESVPTHRLIVLRRSGISPVLLKLCLGWARVLHLVYYRLWFGRVAPRLRAVIPLKNKSLWSSWIKTRI